MTSVCRASWDDMMSRVHLLADQASIASPHWTSHALYLAPDPSYGLQKGGVRYGHWEKYPHVF
jgi:hypothetical protein